MEWNGMESCATLPRPLPANPGFEPEGAVELPRDRQITSRSASSGPYTRRMISIVSYCWWSVSPSGVVRAGGRCVCGIGASRPCPRYVGCRVGVGSVARTAGAPPLAARELRGARMLPVVDCREPETKKEESLATAV